MLKNEVWMVIQRRQDGALPDPVKCLHAAGRQALHFTEEDAIAAMGAINAELGGDFAGVYRCLLEVVEDKTPIRG